MDYAKQDLILALLVVVLGLTLFSTMRGCEKEVQIATRTEQMPFSGFSH